MSLIQTLFSIFRPKNKTKFIKNADEYGIPMLGYWKDTYVYSDGRRIETEWVKNQIQNTAPVFACALFRRAGENAFPGFGGVSHIGIGSGNVAWDITPPTQDENDTTLTAEFFRKVILESDMAFLDPTLPAGSPAIVGPSRKLGITVTLLPAESNGSLREFGLFGGLATGALDSGIIMNWIVHSLITKDATLTIIRNIEIEFLEP